MITFVFLVTNLHLLPTGKCQIFHGIQSLPQSNLAKFLTILLPKQQQNKQTEKPTLQLTDLFGIYVNKIWIVSPP